jgi:uncharacterized membrane protein
MGRLDRIDLRHPVNRRLRDDAPLGARVADRVTDFLGSWTFLAIQTVIVVAWIAGNVLMLLDRDPFPFILLNLAFSTQAAYAAHAGADTAACARAARARVSVPSWRCA